MRGVRVLEVLPGEGAARLRLGMTMAEAEQVAGPPETAVRGWLQFDRWSWHHNALQAEFDGDGNLGELVVTWVRRQVSARVLDVDLFEQPAPVVVARLEDLLGPGTSDGRGFSYAWPGLRFVLWRVAPPGGGGEELRRGQFWETASSTTEAYAVEAAGRAAVRRDDLVG